MSTHTVITPSRRVARFTLATAIVTFFPIAWGSVVRVTGSGSGCGTAGGGSWPLCRGHFLPAPDAATLVEFSHRMLAFLLSVFIGVLVVWAWVKYRSVKPLLWGATLNVVFLIIQIALGAITIDSNLASPIVFVHLANAEILFSCTIVTCLATYARVKVPVHRSSGRRMFTLAAIAVVLTYAVIITGSLTVNVPGAATACDAWPFCGNGFDIPQIGAASVNVLHRLLVGVDALYVGFVLGKTMMEYRGEKLVTYAALAGNILLVIQIADGAVMALSHMAEVFEILHLMFATAYFGALIVVTASLYLRERVSASPHSSPALHEGAAA